MKKFSTISLSAVLICLLAACSDREPGRAYMPDMSYSRAYETYSPTDKITQAGAYYNQKPVTGSVARGDAFPFTLSGDTANYARSASIPNPLNKAEVDMVEAERLYLINCGICHGAQLDGNGPLWNGGDGPYGAAPKNFMDAQMKQMAEGTMFFSATYGKGAMGSYASQLNSKQRWMVIAYIKNKQAGASTADSSATAKPMAAATDSASTATN